MIGAEPKEGSGALRHSGLLVVAGAGLCVGAIATLLPSLRFAESPDIVGWLVGVVILASGVVIVGRTQRAAGGWLIAAGVAWHLSDVARLLPVSVRDVGQRSALVHVALLGVAILGLIPLPPGRFGVRVSQCAVLVLLVAAVSGWTGGWRVALPVAGAAVLTFVGVALSDSTVRSSVAGAAWVGAGVVFGADLLGAAFVRHFVDDADVERWLIAAHQLAVAATSVLLALSVARTRRVDAVELGFDKLANLEQVVAGALGVRSVSIALAAEHDGWLDVNGREVERPADPTLLIDDELVGRVALLGFDEPGVGDVPVSAWRVLRLARDHARLRATISRQVAELAASRRRIVAAQDRARFEVHEALRDGPLVTLREIEHEMAGVDTLGLVRQATVRARANLEELSRDLDPVSSGRTLAVALHDVVESCPARVELRVDPSLDLADDVARTVWFTVSEALTNVVKHAPGASVSVTVAARRHDSGTVGVVVTICDDGPGGADPRGSGLQGLADRVDAFGGSLRVGGDPCGGTRVELRV
ncbi:MAG: hypothetical protein ABI862_15410 [Ilumatobacteraceae bacterium]